MALKFMNLATKKLKLAHQGEHVTESVERLLVNWLSMEFLCVSWEK